MSSTEQPKRKPRTPLSQEELFYYIQYKKLKEHEKLQKFKATTFYKVFNFFNVFLVALITYSIFSILFVCCWDEAKIESVTCTYGATNIEKRQRTIAEIQVHDYDGGFYHIKTDDFYTAPQENEMLFLAKDFIFGKVVKVKFEFEPQVFWTMNSYASLTISFFALFISFFVYRLNRHLTTNGLLTVFGLLFLSSLYFVFV